MSKKFVKAVGLHNVFNEISDTSLDIASIKSNISEIVNSDSVIFITANEDDIYGYPSGSKYIWAQNELYPTNYPNIYTATLEDASNGEDGLATAVDIYNTIESLERVIATHISVLGDVVGVDRDYSIAWDMQSGISASTIKEGVEYVATNYAKINDEWINTHQVWSSSKVNEVLHGKQNINYLKFTANESNSTITFYNYESNSPDIQYSFDGESWYQWYENEAITLWNTGSYIYVKGNNQSGFSSANSYSKFGMSGSIAASGNIMSLIDGGECAQMWIPCDYCFRYLFGGCTSLTSAPELPATTLADGCYTAMFIGCTSLTSAPELPATTLAARCYSSMFSGCTSLTSAPELPATTLADNCYSYMFQYCTSLVNAPELPATTLANYCYSNMFRNCTSLTSAPELPATTLVDYCYQYMFQNCASLNYIKCLATSGISTNYSTTNWVSNVANSGTFIKMPDVMWPMSGTNGIPRLWNIVSLSSNQIYDNGHVYDIEKYSLAEGSGTVARGMYSHSEGMNTCAAGFGSHAEGICTLAQNEAEHASGQYNVSHISMDDAYSTQMSVGVGNQYISKNALEVYRNGNIYINGIGDYDGTDINKNVPRPIQETLVQSAIGGANHIWCGTQLEYDSLPVKYINTLYFIKEDARIEYVDLGLTSHNLWATANIGATNSDTSISWYGQYFAWGDIYPSMFYNWESYKFCADSSDNLIKYCDNTNYGYNGFTDVLNILEPSDDVANAVYGGDWRIPSTEDFEELLNETEIEWITDYQGIMGLNGYTFSKNEETLFLPMAGYSYYDSNSQTSEINEDSGNYWTSEITLNGNGADARSAIILYFNTNNMPAISDNIRCQGLSVRPILKPRENLSSAESEIR